MSNYRRSYIPGGSYFFTLITYQRQKILCDPIAIEQLKEAFRYIQNTRPFTLHGLVIMPDHLHSMWQLPENDDDYSIRWQLLKRYFSTAFNNGLSRSQKKEIWQRRFWEHTIRDEEDFDRHLDYIYYNPVKHGYVSRPIDWKFSTFTRDIQNGLYTPDWGCDVEPKTISYLDLE